MRLALLAICFLAGCPDAQTMRDDAECAQDSQCALLPQLTCCGECPPTPPFEVGTREDLDAIFIEAETRCAEDTRACAPPTCAAKPRGCYARAACVSGSCVVESEGC